MMTSGMIAPMAGMGLLTSVVAPAVVLATRARWQWRRLTLPAGIALPGFVLAHAGITLVLTLGTPTRTVTVTLHLVLFLAAVVFWLPVLGPCARLSRPARCVYLFLAAPALDLAGVVVVATGDSAGGLAMIVAMLPIGLAAVGLTWRWLQDEERAVQAEAATADRLV
jgi:cytochrome c oxidase assembly factor CtaG